MANTAKIRYAGNVIPVENVEDTDSDYTSIIHSKIDKAIGATIEKTLASVTSIVYEASQTVNSTAYADFDGDSCTYEGFTWIDNNNTPVTGIDFLFARIIEPVTSGEIPSVYITLDNGTTDLIKLEGIGDWCLIPLNDYTVQDADDDTFLQAKAVSASTYAKIEWMVGKI